MCIRDSSLAALDELAVVLAANISHVADVRVEYERESDSHGRLIMSFDDVLAAPSSPAWATASPTIALVEEPSDDLGEAIAVFTEEPALRPPLRVIDGEVPDVS